MGRNVKEAALAAAPEYVRLDGTDLTLVFVLEKGVSADLAYLGQRLPDGENLNAIVASQTRGRHESQPDTPPVPGLLPERKGGWSGTPAVALTRMGEHRTEQVDTDFRVASWEADASELYVEFADQLIGVMVETSWRVTETGAIATRYSVSNHGNTDFDLVRLSALALPVPSRFSMLTTYSGRWAGEMHEQSRSIAPDGFAHQSVIGKPGFSGANWLLIEDPATGEVMAAHLAWSGDHDTRIECDNSGASDGRAMLQMAIGWDAQEPQLFAGGSFESGEAIVALGSGRSDLAQRLHAHVRSAVLPDRPHWEPRKVHLNSWEALGFDLSQTALEGLARAAANLGIERFVLDDGWFGAKGNTRRDDTTSLGDWIVSPEVFPNGLDPLIAHVHSLGMDFGLWVEPEMISPDSDLYRAHPDWCVHAEGRERPKMRGQLTLDLTRREVTDYLFERLDALLRDHDIAYLKWDHNRDLFPASGKRFGQTASLYGLLDRLRATHPAVEIEGCASGGGRIDYGILQRTHRVWPSDSNDPIERLRIMRSWSQFLPLEVLGSHVGPSPNPITGRATCMDFRAKVALFGHMGVEANPRTMSEDERRVLAAHIALHKDWRDVLHTGDLWRLEHPDPGVGGLMVTHDAKAIALTAQTGFAQQFDVSPVRLKGLDPTATYRVTLPEPWPAKASTYLADPDAWREGLNLSGAALMAQGIALPLTHPETAWLIALERLTR